MKVSKESRKGARALYTASLTNGRLDEAKIRNVLAQVIERHPIGYGQILHEYHRLIRMEVERRTAVVESAGARFPDCEACGIQRGASRNRRSAVAARADADGQVTGGRGAASQVEDAGAA